MRSILKGTLFVNTLGVIGSAGTSGVGHSIQHPFLPVGPPMNGGSRTATAAVCLRVCAEKKGIWRVMKQGNETGQ